MDNKRTLFECDCGCGALSVDKFDDENFAYVSYYVSAFYQLQESFLEKFVRRIKFAAYILSGKEFHLWEIALPKKSALELASMLEHWE